MDTFFLAIANERVDDVARLIEAGADVNGIWEGRSPLCQAVFRAAFVGDDDVVQLLLARGAHVDSRIDAAGCGDGTALHLAASLGSESTARLLLSHGAQIDARDDADGYTPLHRACLCPEQNNMVNLLVQHGADVNARANDECAPLHVAALASNSHAAQLLIANGADVNMIGPTSGTPLHLACCSGSEPVTRLLLDNGADVSFSHEAVVTPLHAALRERHGPVALLLMERGGRQLLEADHLHPGLWAHFFALVNQISDSSSVIFSLIREKPDLFGFRYST